MGRWNFIFNNVNAKLKIKGNIETLLDYKTVMNGEHPLMAEKCYYCIFYGCTNLVQAPTLPATTLTNSCYDGMFHNCTRLAQAPELPATALANGCYHRMFYGCTSLIQAPALPATTLTMDCYDSMFAGCISLTKAPDLPATKLATLCYQNMFVSCTKLTQAPALPATTLEDQSCYIGMFQGCTSLITIPALPATALVKYCYYNMFSGCSSIKLSTIQTDEYPYEYRIPYGSATGTTGTDSLTNMFKNTGGTFTGTPTINTTYYTSNQIVYPVTFHLENTVTALTELPTSIKTGESISFDLQVAEDCQDVSGIMVKASISHYITLNYADLGNYTRRFTISNPTGAVTMTFYARDAATPY